MKWITLIIFMAIAQTSLAASMTISYADFVMMNRSQKLKTIKMVQDFLTEYEAKQILNGENPNSPLKKKYHVYKKIMNLFIQEAHAIPQVDQQIHDMTLAQNNDPNLRCIYAGNISRYHTVEESAALGISAANRRCINPSYNLPENDRGAFDAYLFTPNSNPLDVGRLEESNGNNNKCTSTNSVRCNPSVYGEYQGKPICVRTDTDEGLNASYACSAALNQIRTGRLLFPGQDADDLGDADKGEATFNGMMDTVIEKALADSGNGDFSQSLEMIFDICLCGKEAENTLAGSTHPFSHPVTATNDLTNNRYAYYATQIFGGRTCVGLLSQVQNIYEDIQRRCGTNRNYALEASNPWFKNIIRLDDTINTLITAQENATVSDGNGGQRGIDYSLRTSSETLRQYKDRMGAETAAAGFRDRANQIYTAAKASGVCPLSNSGLELSLRRDGDHLIAEFEVPDDYEEGDLTQPSISSIGTPEVRTQFVEKEALAYKFSYEFDGSTAKVQATAVINGFTVVSNQLDLNKNVQLVGSYDQASGTVTLTYEAEENSGQMGGGATQPQIQAKTPEDTDLRLSTGMPNFAGVTDLDPSLSMEERLASRRLSQDNIDAYNENPENFPDVISIDTGSGDPILVQPPNGEVFTSFVYTVEQIPSTDATVTFTGSYNGRPVTSNAVPIPGQDNSLEIGGGQNQIILSEASGEPSYKIVAVIDKMDLKVSDSETLNIETLFANAAANRNPSSAQVTWKVNNEDAPGVQAFPENKLFQVDRGTASDEIPIVANLAGKQSNTLTTKIVEYECAFQKSGNQVSVNLTVGNLDGFSASEHLDISSANLAKTVNQTETALASSGTVTDGKLVFQLAEDAEVDGMLLVKGLKLKVANAPEITSCQGQAETVNPDDGGESSESCAITIAQTASPRSSIPKVMLTARSTEGVEFEWYNMSRRADTEDDDSSEEENPSRLVEDSDSGQNREPAEDENVRRIRSKRLEGVENPIIVNRPGGGRPITIVVLGSKDNKVCGQASTEIQPPRPNNSNPYQINPGQGFGPGGPKTFHEGI